MTSSTGPVMPRRRLGTELRRLREDSGRTLEDVADELLISTSKLSRLENGQGSPQLRDVRDLIRLYGIEDSPLANRLTRWVGSARKQGWWADYASAMDRGLDGYVAYETEASIARVYTIPVLPVLLQTEDYARAQYRAMETWRPAEEIEKLVRLRMQRQEALDAEDSLRLIAVSHESALRQWVGTRETMQAQLAHLLDRSSQANIEFRVLPFTAQPQFTSSCMYAYFEFPDDLDRDVVHIETHAGFRHLETAEQVHAYRRHHDNLMNSSLSVEQSRAMIRSALETVFA